MHFWNPNTGARLNSLVMPARVTSIQFTPLAKGVFTPYGFPHNSIMEIGGVRNAQDSRVMYFAISIQGDVVVGDAGGENVKIWRVWQVPPRRPKFSRKGVVSVMDIR